jgi:hypothetical protein
LSVDFECNLELLAVAVAIWRKLLHVCVASYFIGSNVSRKKVRIKKAELGEAVNG